MVQSYAFYLLYLLVLAEYYVAEAQMHVSPGFLESVSVRYLDCVVTNRPATAKDESLAAVSGIEKDGIVHPASVEEVQAAAADLQQLEGVEVQGTLGVIVSLRVTADQIESAGVESRCTYLVPALPVRPGWPTFRAERGVETAASMVDSRQAAKAMKVDLVQQANSRLDGSGVKIGILSDSFWTLAPKGSSPCTSVNRAIILKEASDIQWDEGRAMAGLICYIAPGAQLYFHRALEGEGDFARGIYALRDAGCDIIVDDISYDTEPWFSPGVITQAAENVKAAGVAYFGAAGNNAGNSWEDQAAWVFTTLPGGTGNSTWHNWGTAEAPSYFLGLYISFTPSSGDRLVLILQWDEPWARSTQGLAQPLSDIDLLACFEPHISVCNLTVSNRNLGRVFEAWEYIEVPLPAQSGQTSPQWVVRYLAIQLRRSRRELQDHRLKLNWRLTTWGSVDILPGSGRVSWGASTLVPHTNTAGVMAVGASRYRDTPGYGVSPTVLRASSSWGTIGQYLDKLGNRLPNPGVLNKPDVVGPDGTETSFFGFDEDGNGVPEFRGTSAAAPHVAAVAALMLQQSPNLPPDSIYDLMRSTAEGMPAAGWNAKAGYGFIRGDLLLMAGRPVAVPDVGSSKPGLPTILRVLSNDLGPKLKVASVGPLPAGQGSAFIPWSATTVVYRAPLGFTGRVSFPYTIRSLASGLLDTSTITVTVQKTNKDVPQRELCPDLTLPCIHRRGGCSAVAPVAASNCSFAPPSPKGPKWRLWEEDMHVRNQSLLEAIQAVARKVRHSFAMHMLLNADTQDIDCNCSVQRACVCSYSPPAKQPCPPVFAAAGIPVTSCAPRYHCELAPSRQLCQYRYLTPTTPCRPSQGPCDGTEYCSGHSVYCPADGTAPGGVGCSQGAKADPLDVMVDGGATRPATAGGSGG